MSLNTVSEHNSGCFHIYTEVNEDIFKYINHKKK